MEIEDNFWVVLISILFLCVTMLSFAGMVSAGDSNDIVDSSTTHIHVSSSEISDKISLFGDKDNSIPGMPDNDLSLPGNPIDIPSLI